MLVEACIMTTKASQKSKKAEEAKKMEKDKKGASYPEFPRRLYTKDDEPHPGRSVGYFSKTAPMFDAVKRALREDEWEEIRGSRLGVFIDYHEYQISWASRLVHFILGWQIVCNKKHEIWSLIGATPIRFSIIEFAHITGLNCDYAENLMSPDVEVTEEMKEFWEQMGVGVEAGPTYEELLKACEYCDSWDREDRLRLGYLSILAACIDARAHGSAINVNLARLVMDLDEFVKYPWGRVAFKVLVKSVKEADITKTYQINGFVQALQSWVFFALPKFASEYGEPTSGVQTPPLLAYGGAKGRKKLREGMLRQVLHNQYFDVCPETS